MHSGFETNNNRKMTISMLVSVCVVSGIVGLALFLIASLFKNAIIVAFGIFMVSFLNIVAGIGGVVFVSAASAIGFKVFQASQLAKDNQKQLAVDNEAVVKDNRYIAERIRHDLSTVARDNPATKKDILNCIQMLDKVDDSQARVGRLFKKNGSNLPQVEQAIDDAEQVIFKNFHTVINQGIIQARNLSQTITNTLEKNQVIVDKIDELLPLVADYVSEKGSTTSAIDSWVVTLSKALKERGS